MNDSISSAGDSIATEWPQTDSSTHSNATTLMTGVGSGAGQFTYHPSPSVRGRSGSGANNGRAGIMGRYGTPVPQQQQMEAQMKEVPVYVFVFADVVLFTIPIEQPRERDGRKSSVGMNSRSGSGEEGLTLMRGIGVSKVLAMSDVSGMHRESFF